MYNLEEFKEWVEAEPSRKENLNWSLEFGRLRDNSCLKELIEKESGQLQYSKASEVFWKPYQAVALKWVAERERERERAREVTLTC